MSNRILEGELLAPARQTEIRVLSVDGSRLKLNSDVEIAFVCEATEWVRLNHPSQYERLLTRFEDNRGYIH